MSVYDSIAGLYDEWSQTVVEDVAFYVQLAIESGGPVVELGVGTGRIAVPIAEAGLDVIGVDSSRGMLSVCASRAEAAGVHERIDLRVGDLTHPPVEEPVPLVIVPFRAYLHLDSRAARLQALRGARSVLAPGGHLAFDVFRPNAQDVEETHGRWLEREPGIWERADWDTDAKELVLSVRGPSGETRMRLHWSEASAWRELLDEAEFELEGEFGWFDRQPPTESDEMVFIARRPDP